MAHKLAATPDVTIDEEGKFKYVLLQLYVEPKAANVAKLVVRGARWAPFHDDIYESEKTTMNSQGVQVESLGGGQIVHDPRSRTITIGGMSHGLGKADHNLAAALLSRYYPGYSITVTD
ncbi:14 kDa phosphohistidine phosphatase-like [Thrips palmi]|uniref:14 kDa phosphohistidine phosphatase-like n=1 Tax=Thrips palmi TaxID=161013 RepID=A0A6P8ZUQ0_THRPL|nr:14 kDa phosphohistidine phosphatase-like [Thrips palmi]